MEVMNRAELTQNDILVGQKSVTRSFGVSDDPMLMSMLSTGFYQNPLRTMIQEIMFNAWDAHRMGNCQDRPIDIYINDTTGLIVRDYGPGIEPGEDDDNMHEIYCMYGGSTKRKLKNQTGGFGLGSKSPFAYTESFTVTSHFGGMKNMYLISRVSEANGGKPGMTSLVRVPTTETGLMVTVPLKAGHMERTYDNIKDVLFLSGIKAMIHYADKPDEYVDSLTLPPRQYYVSNDHHGSSIYAVYGGVRYKIPHSEEYNTEYKFMKLLGNGKDVFVGFAPDTLSPLPNREGLNMGEKSKETVKATFELCTEKFQETFEPVTKLFFKTMFADNVLAKIQGKFAFIDVANYGTSINARNVFHTHYETLLLGKPNHISYDVWTIAANFVLFQTESVYSIIGKKRWKLLFLKAFLEAYPECSDLAFAVNKEDFNNVFPVHDTNQTKDYVADFYRHQFLREQDAFIAAMKATYPDDDKLHPEMKLFYGDKWSVVNRYRSLSNTDKTQYGIKGLKSTDPRLARKQGIISLQSIYIKKDQKELGFLMMDRTIIIAKTNQALNDTMIPTFVAKHRHIAKTRYRYSGEVNEVVPAYVIHERKGAYDKALEILTNLGFTVVEGAAPPKKVYAPKVKTAPVFAKIEPREDEWQSRKAENQFTDPTHLWYGTLATIKGYNSKERPDIRMVDWFLKKNPKTVVVTNIKTAENLEKEGVIPFSKAIISWYNEKSQDKDRMTNIIRATKIMGLASLPKEILYHPLMQLELGMEPVDTSDPDFWYDSQGFEFIANTGHYPLSGIRDRVKKDLEDLWTNDPERQNVLDMCTKTRMFDEGVLSSLWSSTQPSDRDLLVEKIITTINLFK